MRRYTAGAESLPPKANLRHANYRLAYRKIPTLDTPPSSTRGLSPSEFGGSILRSVFLAFTAKYDLARFDIGRSAIQ